MTDANGLYGLNQPISLPVGALMISFKSGAHALNTALHPIKGRAMAAVEKGHILRFDAMLGSEVKDRMLDLDLVPENEGSIEHSKWYGTCLLAGLVIGPFDRKSQAMNGLALAFFGLDACMGNPEPAEDEGENDEGENDAGKGASVQGEKDAVTFSHIVRRHAVHDDISVITGTLESLDVPARVLNAVSEHIRKAMRREVGANQCMVRVNANLGDDDDFVMGGEIEVSLEFDV